MPTAVAVFQDGDIAIRRYGESSNTIVRWTKYPHGGHYVARACRRTGSGRSRSFRESARRADVTAGGAARAYARAHGRPPEVRASDSPLVERITRVRFGTAWRGVTTPDRCWDIVVRRVQGRVELLQTGLIARPVELAYEARDEYLSISFKPGVWSSRLSGRRLTLTPPSPADGRGLHPARSATSSAACSWRPVSEARSQPRCTCPARNSACRSRCTFQRHRRTSACSSCPRTTGCTLCQPGRPGSCPRRCSGRCCRSSRLHRQRTCPSD